MNNGSFTFPLLIQQLGTALTQNGYGQTVLSTMFQETNATADYLLYHLLRYRMTIHHFIISPHSVAPETPTHPTLHLLMKTWMDSFSHVADMTGCRRTSSISPISHPLRI